MGGCHVDEKVKTKHVKNYNYVGIAVTHLCQNIDLPCSFLFFSPRQPYIFFYFVINIFAILVCNKYQASGRPWSQHRHTLHHVELEIKLAVSIKKELLFYSR